MDDGGAGALLEGLGFGLDDPALAGGDDYPPDTQPDERPPERSDEEHAENIAEILTDEERRRLGDAMLRAWEADRAAREPWETAARRGKEALGMLAQLASDEDTGGLNDQRSGGEGPREVWQSKAVAPLAIESLMRMTASIQKEIFRPGGVCRGKVIGERWASQEIQERADRVAAFVNLLYSDDELMPDARSGLDQLVQLIVDEGGAFREPYWDHATGQPDVAMHTIDRVWMPFDARSVYRARRVTIAYPLLAGTIRRMQRDGYYVETGGDLSIGDPEKLDTDVDRAARLAGGYTEERQDERNEDNAGGEGGLSSIPDDTMLMCGRHFTFRALPDDIDGGLVLPYLATITPDGKLLRLERDWKNGDAYAKRIRRLVPYGMFPVPRCPYPIGINHMLGFLAETATDVLRLIIDSTRRSMRTTTLLGNEVNIADLRESTETISPNGADELIQIKTSGMEFRNALVTLRSEPPSAVPFNLLGLLKDAYEKAANTADLMAGTANSQGPVGTAMILVEQGSRVYGAVHSRIHASASAEYRQLLRVIRDNIDPYTTYPMQVTGTGEKLPILPDIDERIDVEPVSDPTEYSETQRIAKAQAMFEAYLKDPTPYDKRAVHARFHEAIGTPNIGELLPEAEEVPRCDVVTENQRLLMGMPIRAYQGQAHQAHQAEHARFFGGLPPDGQKMLQSSFLAHMAEHLALQYREQAAQALGMLGEMDPARMISMQPDLWEQREDRDRDTLSGDPQQERLLDAMVAAAMADPRVAGAMGAGGGAQQQGEPQAQSDPAQMIRARAAAAKTAGDLEAQKRGEKRAQEAHDVQMQRDRIEIAKGLQQVQGAARDATAAGSGGTGEETAGGAGPD